MHCSTQRAACDMETGLAGSSLQNCSHCFFAWSVAGLRPRCMKANANRNNASISASISSFCSGSSTKADLQRHGNPTPKDRARLRFTHSMHDPKPGKVVWGRVPVPLASIDVPRNRRQTRCRTYAGSRTSKWCQACPCENDPRVDLGRSLALRAHPAI